MLQQQVYDLRLLLSRIGRSATPAAGVLHREVKRRGATPILATRIGAELEENAHGVCAAGANRAMQGRHAALVRGIGVSPCANQKAEYPNPDPHSKTCRAPITRASMKSSLPTCGPTIGKWRRAASRSISSRMSGRGGVI